MTRMAAGIWIDAPPDRVLKVVGAPPGPLLPEGGPRLVIEGPPGQAGTRYRWEFQRLGLNFRVDSEVTECRPGQRIAFHGTAGWEMETQVDCKPEAGGTRLLFSMRFRFGAPARWLIPGALIRLGVWHALRRVKAMTEAGSSMEALNPV